MQIMVNTIYAEESEAKKLCDVEIKKEHGAFDSFSSISTEYCFVTFDKLEEIDGVAVKSVDELAMEG